MTIDKVAIEDALAKHAKEPGIDIESHVRNLRISLGLEVRSRKKIYLDKRYWIFIRDAHMGRAKSPIHTDLLARLREFVGFNNGLCPISGSLFCELNKQTDIETKRATAKLMDELSLGVSLCPFEERVSTEIAHFLYAAAGLEVYGLSELVWLKLSYALGIIWPSNTTFDKETERVIQKSFTDHVWSMPLVEVIDSLEKGGGIEPPAFDELAKKLNVGNAAHSDEITRFEQAYWNEISGGFSLFKSGKVSKQLPSLHVYAKCHAAIRFDKKRKIKPNDIYDLHHAAGAIGYCDAFFTENPLKVLLTSGHVALDKEIGCIVISDETDAIEYLEMLR